MLGSYSFSLSPRLSPFLCLPTLSPLGGVDWSRQRREGHFPREMCLLSATDMLERCRERRAPWPGKGKNLSLTCREAWAEALPGGLPGAHCVLSIRGPVSQLAVHGLGIRSVIILFLRYRCHDSCPLLVWWLL